MVGDVAKKGIEAELCKRACVVQKPFQDEGTTHTNEHTHVCIYIRTQLCTHMYTKTYIYISSCKHNLNRHPCVFPTRPTCAAASSPLALVTSCLSCLKSSWGAWAWGWRKQKQNTKGFDGCRVFALCASHARVHLLPLCGSRKERGTTHCFCKAPSQRSACWQNK